MAINSPYVDSLIITWHTDSEGKKVSVLRENEQQKVVNGKITLSEIPDEFYGVTISGYNEVKYGKIINETDFKVNYALGEVTFHPSQEGKTITVDSYYGRGIIYYPSSRIYYTTSPDGDVETTLQDFLDSIAAYSYKGIYDNNTIYSQNNIVYYNGTTYICEAQTTVGNPPTDETRWRPMSAGYNERGLFNELVQYYPRDIVEYDYALYVCKIKPPIGTLPTNTFYFDKLLSIENLQSLINNTKYVGEYHDDTQYYQNNIVSFNGCSYIAKKNTLGNRPPLLPLVENEYWGLIAVKGYDGANLAFKGVYREDVQYDKDDLVYYSDATVSGVFVALQSTYGNPPTNTEYWTTFMLGGGDMNKAQYDYNNDGVVNDSDKLGGQLPSYYAKQEDLDAVQANLDAHKADYASHKAENATDAHKISNITGLQTELDKKASNKNLLVNWDFRNPVNQRGFTSTTNAGYTIDRWRLPASGHTVEVVSDGIKLIAGKNAGLNNCFVQSVENYSSFVGVPLTLSVHIVENTLTQGCNLRWNDSASPVIMGTGYFSTTFTPSSLSYLQIGVQFNNRDVDDGNYLIIDKMKLELGSVSTLANDPPAVYSEQLAFCGSIVLTATLNTPWSGTSAPYTKTVTVNGIQSSDTPIIDVVMSGTYSTDTARAEAWGYIHRAVTGANSITFYATDKPTVDLPIQIRVVR